MACVQEQRSALRQLNYIKTGSRIADLAALDGCTPENLRTRIGEHSTVVKHILLLLRNNIAPLHQFL